MPSPELERLADRGLLKREPPILKEYQGLLQIAARRLEDAKNEDLHTESRFDLAYGAAHSLAVAALRRQGYRSENRQIVFQALAHTVGASAATWRLFAQCHEQRNRRDYDGVAAIGETLLRDLLEAASELLATVAALEPPGNP